MEVRGPSGLTLQNCMRAQTRPSSATSAGHYAPRALLVSDPQQTLTLEETQAPGPTPGSTAKACHCCAGFLQKSAHRTGAWLTELRPHLAPRKAQHSSPAAGFWRVPASAGVRRDSGGRGMLPTRPPASDQARQTQQRSGCRKSQGVQSFLHRPVKVTR